MTQITATGKLRVDASDVLKAQQTIARAAQAMSQSLEKVGNVDIGKNLRNTAAFTGIVTAGVDAARSMQTLNATFRVLNGSQELANQRMQQLRDLADKTGQPFVDLLQASLQFLPTVRQTGVEFTKIVDLAQRLAVLDPVQGIRGAGIALRELFSGDVISLARRFELDRNQIKRLVEDAGGDANALADSFSQFLDSIGIGTDELQMLGEEGVFAFDALRSEITETLASAFTPLLQDAILPAVSGLGDILEQARALDPAFLTLAGSILTVVAASRGLSLAGFGGLGRGVRALGGAAIAVEGGIGIARGLARVGAPESELGQASQSEARGILAREMNRIFQQGFTAAGQLVAVLEVGAQLISAGIQSLANTIGTMAELFGKVLSAKISTVGETLTLALAKLEMAFGEQLLALGQALFNVTGERNAIGDAGVELFNRGLARSEEAEARLASLGDTVASLEQEMQDAASLGIVLPNPEEIAERMALIANNWTTVGQVVAEALFGAGEEVAEELVDSGEAVGNSLFAMFRPIAQAIVEGSEQIDEFNQEVARMVEEFNIEFQNRNIDRAIDARREEEDFLRQRLRDLEDYQRRAAEIERDGLEREQEQLEEIQSISDEAEQEKIEKLKDFNKESQRLAEDHQLRLQEIIMDASFELEDAIASRDSAAAQKAVRNAERAIAKENQEYGVRSQRRQEDFDEMIADLESRAEERRQAALEELQEIRENNAERLRDLRDDFVRRMAMEDEDRRIRLTRQQEDYVRQDQLQRAAMERKIQIMQAELMSEIGFTQAVTGVVRSFFDNAINMWTNFVAQVTNTVPQYGPQPAPPNYVPPSPWFPGPPFAPAGGSGSGGGGGSGYSPTPFADGGFVTRTGVALLHAGEVVLNGRQQSMMGGTQVTTIVDLSGSSFSGMSDEDVRRLKETIEESVIEGTKRALDETKMQRKKL